jgi:hypothetical protein
VAFSCGGRKSEKLFTTLRNYFRIPTIGNNDDAICSLARIAYPAQNLVHRIAWPLCDIHWPSSVASGGPILFSFFGPPGIECGQKRYCLPHSSSGRLPPPRQLVLCRWLRVARRAESDLRLVCSAVASRPRGGPGISWESETGTSRI